MKYETKQNGLNGPCCIYTPWVDNNMTLVHEPINAIHPRVYLRNRSTRGYKLLKRKAVKSFVVSVRATKAIPVTIKFLIKFHDRPVP